jgi:hypothetical protein
MTRIGVFDTCRDANSDSVGSAAAQAGVLEALAGDLYFGNPFEMTRARFLTDFPRFGPRDRERETSPVALAESLLTRSAFSTIWLEVRSPPTPYRDHLSNDRFCVDSMTPPLSRLQRLWWAKLSPRLGGLTVGEMIKTLPPYRRRPQLVKRRCILPWLSYRRLWPGCASGSPQRAPSASERRNQVSWLALLTGVLP